MDKFNPALPVAPAGVFAATTPAELTQRSGLWDLRAAVGTTLKLFIDKARGSKDELQAWELALYEHLRAQAFPGLQLN